MATTPVCISTSVLQKSFSGMAVLSSCVEASLYFNHVIPVPSPIRERVDAPRPCFYSVTKFANRPIPFLSIVSRSCWARACSGRGNRTVVPNKILWKGFTGTPAKRPHLSAALSHRRHEDPIHEHQNGLENAS